jgi:hypothetical protein
MPGGVTTMTTTTRTTTTRSAAAPDDPPNAQPLAVSQPPAATVDAQPRGVSQPPAAPGQVACRQCGSPFVPCRRWQLYCTDGCGQLAAAARRRLARQRARSGRPPASCCQCGRAMRSRRKDAKFCSSACRQAAHTSRCMRRPPPVGDAARGELNADEKRILRALWYLGAGPPSRPGEPPFPGGRRVTRRQLAEGFGDGGGSYNARWLRALKDLQLRGLVRVFRARPGARSRGTRYRYQATILPWTPRPVPPGTCRSLPDAESER